MSSAGPHSPSLAILQDSNIQNYAPNMYVWRPCGSKRSLIHLYVFVPFAEVSPAKPIKVLLCRLHFDISVRMNLDIVLKNKENKAHAFARFVFLERPENVLIMYYVACCPGSENEDYIILPRYKCLPLLRSLLFFLHAPGLAIPKQKDQSRDRNELVGICVPPKRHQMRTMLGVVRLFSNFQNYVPPALSTETCQQRLRVPQKDPRTRLMSRFVFCASIDDE